MAKKGKGKAGGKGKRYAGKGKKAPAFSGAAARRAAAKGDTSRPRTPRSKTLPGMERHRDGTLDNLCEAIGDVRDTMNTSKGEEKGLVASALKRMQGRKLSIYKHARVELAMVPGTAKLRVRVTKEDDEVAVVDAAGETEPTNLEREDAGNRFEATGEGDDIGAGLDEVH